MQILEKIGSLPAYQNLVERLRSGLDTIETAPGLGLPRAARLALVARLQRDLQCPVLLLSNRADRALALYEELTATYNKLDDVKANSGEISQEHHLIVARLATSDKGAVRNFYLILYSRRDPDPGGIKRGLSLPGIWVRFGIRENPFHNIQ